MKNTNTKSSLHLPEVYLSLGGNIGNSVALLRSVIYDIAALKGIFAFKSSRLYRTSPVSELPQDAYVNAACSFKTAMDIKILMANLQKIEKLYGKVPKEKNAPRVIDIDILFFGLEQYSLPELEVPHPRWKERLFVIQPLSDLASFIGVPCASGQVKWVDIAELKCTFSNPHHETVSEIDEPEGALCLSLR